MADITAFPPRIVMVHAFRSTNIVETIHAADVDALAAKLHLDDVDGLAQQLADASVVSVPHVCYCPSADQTGVTRLLVAGDADALEEAWELKLAA